MSNIKGGAIWLLMSNLMGRQLAFECLRVESRFINGQMLLKCLGCRKSYLKMEMIIVFRVPKVETALFFCMVRARLVKTGQLVMTGYDWSPKNGTPVC